MAERGSYRRTLHEAAHKADDVDLALEPEDKLRHAGRPKAKKVYHEAAHKLGYWGPEEDDGEDLESEEAKRRFAELADYLVGKDPSPIEDHWTVLYRGGFYRGGAIHMSALAGIDLPGEDQ